jgi:hypothetical protein
LKGDNVKEGKQEVLAPSKEPITVADQISIDGEIVSLHTPIATRNERVAKEKTSENDILVLKNSLTRGSSTTFDIPEVNIAIRILRISSTQSYLLTL